jgi:hypothetical protein
MNSSIEEEASSPSLRARLENVVHQFRVPPGAANEAAANISFSSSSSEEEDEEDEADDVDSDFDDFDFVDNENASCVDNENAGVDLAAMNADEATSSGGRASGGGLPGLRGLGFQGFGRGVGRIGAGVVGLGRTLRGSSTDSGESNWGGDTTALEDDLYVMEERREESRRAWLDLTLEHLNEFLAHLSGPSFLPSDGDGDLNGLSAASWEPVATCKFFFLNV